MARDSLDIVEFVMELEREFGTEFLSESFDRIRPYTDITVGTIYSSLTRSSSIPTPRDPEWHRLAVIVARFLTIPVDDVTWDTRPFA